MATVQKYNTPAVTPENIPLRGVEVSTNPNSFGASIGKATAQYGATEQEAGRQTAETATYLQNLYQETVANENLNKWQDDSLGKESEFRKLQGKAAMDALPDYVKSITDSVNDQAAQMPPMAAKMFREVTQRQGFYMKQNATLHAAAESQKWEADTNLGAVKSSIDQAGFNAGNPEALAGLYGRMINAGNRYGQLKDYGQDGTDNFNIQNSTKFWSKVVSVRAAQEPHVVLNDLLNQPEKFPGLDESIRYKLITSLQKQLKVGTASSIGSVPGTSPTSGGGTESVGEGEGGGEDDYLTMMTNAHEKGAEPVTLYMMAQDGTAVTPVGDDIVTNEALPEGPVKQANTQAIAAKTQQLISDPAAYAQEQDNSIFSGLSSGDPAQLRDAVEKQDNIYKTMGIQSTDLLSTRAAQSTVAHLQDMGGRAAVTRLNEARGMMGEDIFHRYHADLVRKGGLPEYISIAAGMTNPIDQNLLLRSMELSKDKDLEKAMPTLGGGDKGWKGQIETKLAGDVNFRAFAASLTASGFNDSQIATVTDLTRRMSYQGYMENMTPDAAATNAVRAIAGQYKMLGDVARVPTEIFPTISNNAQVALDKLQASSLAVPIAGNDPDMAEKYKLGVVATGRWVTNSDETGLVRQDADRRLVRLKDGRPLTVPFTWPARGQAAIAPVPPPPPAEPDSIQLGD